MRTIELDEVNPKQLPQSDFNNDLALTLHNLHKGRIDVEFPSPVNDNCYVLRPRGYVGQFPISEDVCLWIRPKVPVNNLFNMLEYAYNLKSFQFLEGITEAASLEDVFERLASILAKRVLDRARKGLYKDYVPCNDYLPFIRGKIMLVPLSRALIHGSTQLPCEYENYTADLDDNHIIAWTLYHLPRMGFQREEVQQQVRKAYRVLAHTVAVRPMGWHDCLHRFYHRLNDDYRPIHGLCRFFLEHCGPSIVAGEHEFIPFNLNMPSLFESFVAEWLKANLPPEMSITPQHRISLEKDSKLVFNIDLVIRDSKTDHVLCVLDTKYKRENTPNSRDIEQIIAYAEIMGSSNAFLIYPSNITRSVNFMAGKVKVRSFVFDIGSNPHKAGNMFLTSLTDALS